MPTILIDGREMEIPAGRMMNVIEAARMAGVKIPHYCWHPAMSVVGSCRMCLVEVGMRDPKSGRINMQQKLVPACNTQVVENLVVVTQSEKVARARAMVEEDLLLRHPIDCPICDKAGECKLQDYHYQYGQGERRADARPFTSRRSDLGDVTLFTDRCVLCGRCVRVTSEISGTRELMIAGRGTHEEIDVVPGFPLHNKLSGNVVDLCPVGALADRDFLYRQRVWFLRRHRGVCTGCASGCSIWIEENQERIHRIKPRENPFVNQWWICNDGRYDYPHVHNPRRITGHEPPNDLPSRLGAVGRLAAVVSPHLTVEEAYLLCRFIRGIDPTAILVLGPVPTVGEDERFPGGFTISAEKCPNRRGVEKILAHFNRQYGARPPSAVKEPPDGARPPSAVKKSPTRLARPEAALLHKDIATFDDLLSSIDQGAVEGVWVSGGYKDEWIDEPTARRFERVKLLVVQDLFPSPLTERATYVLPGAAYPERDGSYVNWNDRLQSAPWAIRPPRGVRTEGSLLWEWTGRKGLYQSRAVLDEVAREILYFSAAIDPVPETGIDLKVNWLAYGDLGI